MDAYQIDSLGPGETLLATQYAQTLGSALLKAEILRESTQGVLVEIYRTCDLNDHVIWTRQATGQWERIGA